MTIEPALPEHAEPVHRSARERQRKGPMWGCLRGLGCTTIGLFALLAVIIIGGWWYLGSSSFAGLVRLRIEKTLEARLGRKVYVGPITIERGLQSRIIIDGLRIGNAPGAVNPYFATISKVVVTGGIDSFWGRKIKVGRVDIAEPHIYFEIYPSGAKLIHNFPQWSSGPPSRYEIYHLDLGNLYITGGAFDFLDRRRDLTVKSSGITSTINVMPLEDLYAGVFSSPQFTLRIQDYVPVTMNMRGQIRFTPNDLEFQSLALDGGPDFRFFLKGHVAPLSDGVYNLRLTSQIGLNRIRDMFKSKTALAGTIDFDTTFRGKGGSFALSGGWLSPKLRADAYELSNARGTLKLTDENLAVDIQHAAYGGGAFSGHYDLARFTEPLPMKIDLHYNGVSLEKLFNDWNIKDTGLRGGATGHLVYHWEKDRILAGAGEGSAVLTKNSTAFSQATYPIPLGGSADFALDNGVVTFRRTQLVTNASTIDLSGKLRIVDGWADLLMKIHSSDFSEIDRIAYNFAHSAGKQSFTLMGFGGAGDITGSIHGSTKSPDVVARVVASGTKYNNILLGDSEIDLHYDGGKSVLTFDHATFRDGAARLGLTGAITFPDRGPSPQFDIALDAAGYPIDRAIQAVGLKMAIKGAGTGRVVVTGTPDAGKVSFANFRVHEAKGDLRLNGTVAWAPGKGNTTFDLDIDTTSFPVADIITFLDLGAQPVSGDVTGKLHLTGPKATLGGAGQLTIANGSIYGEPVTSAKAGIIFTKGALKATNVTVVAPAGTITGEAQIDFGTNAFSYTIKSSSIDLSKLKVFSSLANLLGGNVTLSSTGAGTLEQPEVVLEATLNQATLSGLNLPADAPPPKLYIAIRNGQLIVRGSAAGLLTIEGNGSVATDGTLSGLVQIRVTDIAKALAMSPKTASLPASGSLTANLQLGGKLTSFETLRIDATFPEFNVKVSEHPFLPARPLHLSLRDGRLVFDDFELSLGPNGSTPATFVVSGFAEVTGAKKLAIDLHGTLEAALLQLFVADLRADGPIVVAGTLGGTMAAPQFTGTAEFQNASARLPGFPQTIDAITGTLVFRADRIDIDSIRLRLGGGQIVLGGSIALEGMTPKSIRVTMQGTEVAIRYFEGLTFEANFALLLSGDLDRSILTGDVIVNRALYFRDTDIASALLNAVLARRSVTPVVSASWQDHVGLRVHLTSDNTLAIRNNIADFTGSADIEVNGTLGSPVILGLVTLNEGGKIRFQDIDYRLVRGSINFQNPFRVDPFFDIALEARVSGGISEVESGPLDVTVTLTGTLDRMTPLITSDPPASDITLFSLLGLGALTRNTSANSPLTAGAAGRSLLFQSVSRLLNSSALSLFDSFAISPDAGDLDKTGDPGTKVSFEKRISNTVRILVIYNTRDSKNRVSLEWQVTPDWVLQFTRDQLSNEYDIQARFRRRYDGRWAWGSRGRNPLLMFTSFTAPNGNVPPPTPPPITMTTTTVTAPSGAIVTSVGFRSDSATDTAAFNQYVSVKAGEPLSTRNVQNSIKSLFATGNFRDIRVDSEPSGNGVAVVFALYTNFRVTSIEFDGLGGSDRDRALRTLTFHLGDVLSLNAVDHGAVAIQELLKRSGFLDSTVDPETTFVRAQSRASVIFHVARGAAATVGTVTLNGSTSPFTQQQLIEQMKRGPGKRYDLDEARIDADRMRQWLVRKEYRKATVRYVNNTYDPATHKVALHYTAAVGPVVKVEVTGVSRRSLGNILPFRRNQPYSGDAIERASADIVTSLQQRGFYNATVDVDEALRGNVWTSTFHVSPGQQFRLSAVTFSGNALVKEKTLQGVVTTSASGGIKGMLASLLRRPQGVTREQLAADRTTLESYYRLQGFLGASVGTPAVKLNAASSAMTIDFPITEGPRTMVASVAIEGNEQVAAKDLPKLILKPGDALSPTIERDDVLALQNFYSDRGNAEVQVHVREEVSTDRASAHVVYTIAEGPKVILGNVVVRGNTYTNNNVILRTAELEKGQPFSYTAILEAQQRLYRLGIFQRVDIQPAQALTAVSERNVSISVAEGKDLTVAGSIGGTSPITADTGANRISPLVSASIAHRNLFGTGRYLGLELIYARPNRQDVFLTYREPFIGKLDLPIQVTAFQNDDFRRNTHIRQRGGFIEASRITRNQTRWSLRYEYRIAQCIIEHPEGDLCAFAQKALLPGLDRDATNVSISSITPTFFWDRRDDSLNPHRGFFTTASVEYAFRLLAANARFLKEFTQTSWYLPVTDRSTFAMSGRVGLIQDLGMSTTFDTATGITIQNSGVPLSERFTAGGDTSNRAYALDLLGTACPTQASIDAGCRPTLIDILDPNRGHTMAPIGGRALFIVNAEYRFPIAGAFGGQLFADAGNTFSETNIRFGDLRYGVGTGLRYVSPVGPVRFDFGYKLKRQILRYDELGKAVYEKPFAYFITLGYAF
ncbi:MAG: translocation and assembly module TamB [Thermoanaerobaculia bacterium]|jgi:outer membrane protein assembly complex protein YaeT|nr:translocation and assembly module TamB [Thermoanaerobaculia bacterium]